MRTALGIVAAALLAATAGAQEVVREELRRADLTGVEGIEVVVARQVLPPGSRVPLHTHPGDEHLIVIEGGTFETDAGARVEFAAGTAVHFPRGTVHGGLRVVSETPIVIYTTHILDKGAPQTTLSE